MSFAIGALVRINIPKTLVNDQWYYLHDTLGKVVAARAENGTYRVEAMHKRLIDIREDCLSHVHDDGLTPITWKQMEGIWEPKEKA